MAVEGLNLEMPDLSEPIAPVEDKPKEKRPGPTGRVTDPWKRVTDKVAIVAFSKTTRHFAPFDDPEWEIWGLNEEYRFTWMKRWDRWFQIHPEADFRRKGNHNDPKHPEWLQRQKALGTPGCKTFPIYMQDQYSDIPASYKLPLDEIERDLGINYYTSSIVYMLALAAWMGYKEVGLYGVEMASDTEYRYQRPNGEFWLGYMMGKGIKIHLPKEAKLLVGKRYGFDWLPNIGRQNIEFDLMNMKEQESKAMAEMNGALGKKRFLEEQFKVTTDPVAKKALKEVLNKAMLESEGKYGHLNAVSGAKQYLTALMARLDAQIAPSFGAEVRLTTRATPVLFKADGTRTDSSEGSDDLDVDNVKSKNFEHRSAYEGEEDSDV